MQGRWRRLPAADMLLVVGAALALLVNLGRAGLFLWDESLYCGATADMRAHGAWLFPTLEGRFAPVYGKGPLVNWLQGLGTWLLGWSVAVLRLPTALGMLTLWLITAWQARRLIDRQVGRLTLALMMLSPELVHLGRRIMLENLVAPLTAVAFVAYALALRTQARPSAALWRLISAAALALGLLTKQAFGLFAPVALVVAEIAWLIVPRVASVAGCDRPSAQRWAAALGRLSFVGGITVLTAGWWFVHTYQVVGQPFIDSMVGYHIQRRFTESLEGHTRGINAYAASLDTYVGVCSWVIGALGWSALWPQLRQPWQRMLWLTWTAFAGLEYLCVGVLIKTFLPWYQVVVMPPLFIGAAYFLRQWWVAPGLPITWRVGGFAVVAAHAAGGMRMDAVLFLAALGVAHVAVGRCKKDLSPWYEQVAAALTAAAALVIANPGLDNDARARTARSLGSGSGMTVVGGEQLRVWMCYLPEATWYTYGGHCADMWRDVAGAPRIVLDEASVDCSGLVTAGGYVLQATQATPQGQVQVYHLATDGPAS